MTLWQKTTTKLTGRLVASLIIGYVILLVVLPVAVLVTNSLENGLSGFIKGFTQPAALDALFLTLGVALIGSLINCIFGSVTAYVLVRYQFWGKSVINSLVDLPFAIPTAVSGLMLVTVYGNETFVGSIFNSMGLQISYAVPGIILAVTMVTFPFTIRAVQPILEELDNTMEEAAFTMGATQWETFRKITLPQLLPGIITGFTLAFARALAEFGAVIVIAGNIPFKTQLAAIYIYGEMESYNPQGATSVSVILLILAVILLVILNLASRKGGKSHERR